MKTILAKDMQMFWVVSLIMLRDLHRQSQVEYKIRPPEIIQASRGEYATGLQVKMQTLRVVLKILPVDMLLRLMVE